MKQTAERHIKTLFYIPNPNPGPWITFDQEGSLSSLTVHDEAFFKKKKTLKTWCIEITSWVELWENWAVPGKIHHWLWVVKCFRCLYSSAHAVHKNMLEFRCFFPFRSNYIAVAVLASSVLIIREAWQFPMHFSGKWIFTPDFRNQAGLEVRLPCSCISFCCFLHSTSSEWHWRVISCFLCFSFAHLIHVNSFGAVTQTTPTSAKPRKGLLWMGQSVHLER